MSVCPRCATQFTCAMAEQTGQPCWCARLPVAPRLPVYPELRQDQPRCFCPVCMQEWLNDQSLPEST